MKFGLTFVVVLFGLLAAPFTRAQSTLKVDEATPYIQSIAKGLGNDPVRIYEWVRNNVDFTPYAGFRRGAHLTAIELQGNDCDTAALLAALLKASNSSWSLTYKSGLVKIALSQGGTNPMDASTWLAADPTQVAGILKAGGVPAVADSNHVTVGMVWLEASLGGTTYILTPAFKRYEKYSGVALSCINFKSSELIGLAAGTVTNVPGTSSATAYTGATAGKNALRAKLDEYATGLVAHIGANAHELSGLEATGGRRIAFERLESLPVDFPEAFSDEVSTSSCGYGAIPANVCDSFSFKIGTMTYSGLTAELQGRKLAVWFDNKAAKLYIDDAGSPVAQETGFDASTPAEVELGFGSVKRSAAPLPRDGRYIISYAFGRVAGRLNDRLRVQADYVDRNFGGESRQLMSENLYVMSLQYLNLLMEMNEIAGDLSGTRIHLGFHAGIAGQKEVPYVDLPMNKISAWPTKATINEDASKALAHKVSLAANYWVSMLEHTTIEQMLTGEGVSTVKLIQKSVELGKPVYLAKTWADYAGANEDAGVRALLTNYPSAQTTAREITNIEQGLRDGGRLLIPKDNAMVYNDYKGTGYMLVKPEADGLSILMGISGGAAGGYFSMVGGGSMASVASTADYRVNPNFLSVSPPFLSSYIQDPIDMTNGSFYHSVADLTLSGESVHGLALNRRYSSARRTSDPASLGKGWTHSYHMQLEFRHPNDFSLARATVAEAAPFIVALKAMTDIYDPAATAKEGVIPALIACWLGDQLIDTRATLSLGEQDMEFVKLPDGTYAAPAGVAATLIKNSDSTHTLTFRKGSEIKFRASDGKFVSIIDRNNSTGTARTLAATYTAANKVNRVTDAYGRYLQFTYSGDGRLVKVEDSTGRKVEYGEDTRGTQSVFVVKDPSGNSTRYYADDRHRIVELEDARKRTIVTSVYNAWDQVVEQSNYGLPTHKGFMGFAFGATRDTDPTGATSWLYYDERGRTHTTVDALGAVSQTVHDGNNRVILSIDALGSINEFTYDHNHELILAKDALNNTRVSRPESDDSVSWFRRDFNFEGQETVTTYYDFHKPKSVTAPGGIKTEVEYDSRGRVLKMHPASFAPGQWITYTYTDSAGYLSRVVTTYPVQEPKWGDSATPAATKEQSDFDEQGNLIQSIDRRGKKTTYTYDANRRPLTTVRWPGSFTVPSAVDVSTPVAGALIDVRTYDANGDVASQNIDGKGTEFFFLNRRVMTFEHDAQGKPLATWGPDGVRQADLYYDVRGLLEATFDASGAIATTYYDDAKRPVESFDPIYRRTETQYDELGRPIVSITPRGHETATEYDELGRVKKVIDPRNGASNPIEYSYDKDGREKAIKNRRAKTYTTDYADALRKVTTKTPLDIQNSPRATHAANNVRGLPETVTEPSGQVTTFHAYDNEGRVTLQSDGDGVYTKKTYYPGGLLYSVSEPVDYNGTTVTTNANTRTTLRTYDDFGRVISYQDGEGNTIQYTYQYWEAGVLHSGVAPDLLYGVRYPGGFTVGYTYDAYNRLEKVMEWASPPTTFIPANPAPLRTTTYTYDALGRVSTITRPNGTQRKLTYDAAGQTVAIEEIKTGTPATPIWARAFRYDNAGRDGAFYLNDGEITYAYTWPASSSSVHWTSVITTYTPPNDIVAYNDDNQLATFNAAAVVHDADGNMTTGPLPGGSSGTYVYDSRNRLTGAGGSTYRYNPDGLRVQTTGTGAATYAVDPSGGLSRVLARTVGGTTTRYVWGLGLLHEVTGSTVRYYHADQVGSTVAITDSTGAVTDRVDYAPFGEVVARMGATATPFLYNGETGVETDANGLLYMRARYYHPRLMRFINADPLRFEGGMNWYAFAGNDPLSFLDPAGTERIAAMAKDILDYGSAYMGDDGVGSMVMDGVQGALDVIGLIPVFGEPADALNGAISLARGRYGDAAMSFAAMVPVAGVAATGAKFAGKFADTAGGMFRAAENAFAAGGRGFASPGPVKFKGLRPTYDPANFKWGVSGAKGLEKTALEAHELTHISQFTNRPVAVFWASNQLPGRSIAMWGLERQAYQAQAAVLGKPYSVLSPLRSDNTVNAITTDLIYGAAAVGGASVYFQSGSKQ